MEWLLWVIQWLQQLENGWILCHLSIQSSTWRRLRPKEVLRNESRWPKARPQAGCHGREMKRKGNFCAKAHGEHSIHSCSQADACWMENANSNHASQRGVALVRPSAGISIVPAIGTQIPHPNSDLDNDFHSYATPYVPIHLITRKCDMCCVQNSGM